MAELENKPRKKRFNTSMKRHKDLAAAKAQFLVELQKRFGFIKEAVKPVHVSVQTVWQWRQDDPKFNAEVERIKDSFVEVAESALYGHVKKNNLRAISFFLAARSPKYQNKTKFTGEVDPATNAFSFELTTVNPVID